MLDSSALSSGGGGGNVGCGYFFLQSGELVDLGRGELRSLIRTYDPGARITSPDTRVVLVDGKFDLQSIMARAALTKLAGKVLHLSEDNRATSFDFKRVLGREYKTFACELVNLSGKRVSRDVLAELGAYVKREAPWLRVSFKAPDLTLLWIVMETGSVVGLVECGSEKHRSSSKTRKLSYFHPVALRPKLCRTMINLAMVREGETILDPFCGTGSIMLEALSMKINAIGCDLAPKMCRGALANLRSNDKSFIANGDACTLPFRMDVINTVVTDLPYGREASTLKRSPVELLREFLSTIGELKHGRFCVMCRKGDELESPGMVVQEEYDVYEHRSLTRKLMVLCS